MTTTTEVPLAPAAGPPLMPEADVAAPKTKPAPTRAKPTRPAKSGPATSRIVAAAASVSAGIGLVALMAGAQPEVVIEVNPTPILVEPANVIVEMPASLPGAANEAPVSIRVVEAAVAVEQPVAQAQPVARSQGS